MTEKHKLYYGENPGQVYFEGENYLLLNPYTDALEQRCASGWVWYHRDNVVEEWLCLEDPDVPNSCIGDLELPKAIDYAERVTGEEFELIGRPDDLPDSYPLPPWFSTKTTRFTTSDDAMEAEELPDTTYQKGTRVWWKANDEVCTGVVDYVSEATGDVVVRRDDRLTVAGGIPIDRIEHVPPEDLNISPVPEEYLEEISGLENGDVVWWYNPDGKLVIADVARFCYSGERPSIILKRRAGVVSNNGNDVTVEGQVGFTLKEFGRLGAQKGIPEDAVIVEPGDPVVTRDSFTVAAVNVRSPAGNRCRSDRAVEAGELFELVKFFMSQGDATRGSICATIRNEDSYEFDVPIWRLDLSQAGQWGLSVEDKELALLYRDFLSVTNGDESAYSSSQTLRKYQRWARELVIGGKREMAGADFRRFCRIRLLGKERGFDLMVVGNLYRQGRDFVAPQEWACLRETNRHLAARAWEPETPTYPCVGCGRNPDDGTQVLSGWLREQGKPVYLCPNCRQDMMDWQNENVPKAQPVQSLRKKDQEKQADDVPEIIEVDLGHTYGWGIAKVVKKRGKWLYYRLQGKHQDKTDKNGGKVQVYARDILWRPAAS